MQEVGDNFLVTVEYHLLEDVVDEDLEVGDSEDVAVDQIFEFGEIVLVGGLLDFLGEVDELDEIVLVVLEGVEEVDGFVLGDLEVEYFGLILVHLMNSKYEHYLQLFQQEAYNIPDKPYQKLEFLKLIISSGDSMMKIDLEKDFPALEEAEIRALYNLTSPAQIAMFCSIMQSIEAENVDQNITGELHVKGETLGLWKQKQFALNLTAQTLQVPRQDNSVTHLQLPLYRLKWLGEKRSGFTTYWAFQLEAINQNNYNHYKLLVLGSDDQNYANKWFDYFKSVYKKNEQHQENMQRRRNTVGHFRSMQNNLREPKN